jgi:succinate dehydrogenase / fumarate reductase membrane anchor subunit
MAAISEKNPGKITVRRVRLERNFERYAWLFMRLSGVAMLVLAVGHMVIQHILNSSANLTIQFVAVQWSSWGWKGYDILLLWMAIPHGIRGLYNILSDYIHNPGLRRIVGGALALFVIATVIWATIGISLFDSSAFVN